MQSKNNDASLYTIFRNLFSFLTLRSKYSPQTPKIYKDDRLGCDTV